MRMGRVGALLIWFLSPRCDVNTIAIGRLRNAPSQLLRISERPSTLATTVTAQTPKLQAIANAAAQLQAPTKSGCIVCSFSFGINSRMRVIQIMLV